MKQTVITTCQRKGGVGKSTSTLNLAHVIAEEGLRVLIIDLDDQQNTTRSISALVESERTIEDLLLQDDVTVEDVAVATSWKNVSILPSSANLSGVVKHLDGEVGGHLILKEKLCAGDAFDVIFIDTSPSLNILVINALCASDYLFIPYPVSFSACRDCPRRSAPTRRSRDDSILICNWPGLPSSTTINATFWPTRWCNRLRTVMVMCYSPR
jgi:chromosome partitioning protein